MDIQTYIVIFINFLNHTVLPLLLAVAFLFFIWNVVRYFIIGGSDSGSQEQARTLAFNGIVGFAVITAIWGIITLIISMLDIDNSSTITPDYFCEQGIEFGNGNGACRGRDQETLPEFFEVSPDTILRMETSV